MRGKLALPIGMLAFAALACALPGTTAPTPFAFPTPNLTLTAFFSQVTQVAPPPTVTPTAAGLQPIASPTPLPPTATPSAVSPSPTPSYRMTTATPTVAPPLPTATPSYAGPGMRPTPSFAGTYLSNPPHIDGYLEEWSLPIYPVNEVVYGASNWENENDLSGKVMIGWDETYLYLGVRVLDDRYVQNATGLYLYQGDSVEVLLDTAVAGDFYHHALSADDFQLGISAGNPAPGQNMEAYLWFPARLQGRRTGVQMAALRTNHGYQLEAAIPWSVFGVRPFAGQHFGFAFSISDNDVTVQNVQQSMVSNVSTRVLTDPTTWGDLTLVRP